MSFLMAEKKDHIACCPAGRGGKTYLGNARLKTFFFHLDAFPNSEVSQNFFSAENSFEAIL